MIRIREAKITDIPQLLELMEEVLTNEAKTGNKVLSPDPICRRGGLIVQLGQGFNDSNWNITIADRDGDVIAFIIGIIEFCSPCDKHLKAMKVWLDYSKEDSLASPAVLKKMWKRLEKWGRDRGAGYLYCNILPGNVRSIRTAKHVGFKHHYTQFLLVDEKVEDQEEV